MMSYLHSATSVIFFSEKNMSDMIILYINDRGGPNVTEQRDICTLCRTQQCKDEQVSKNCDNVMKMSSLHFFFICMICNNKNIHTTLFYTT